MITEAESLLLLPLATIKAELRIPAFTIPADPTAAAAATAAETAHNDLVTGQVVAAWNFISELTGRGYSDLGNPALRSAAVLLVRDAVQRGRGDSTERGGLRDC